MLCTLAEVKEFIFAQSPFPSTHDTLLNQLIEAASGIINSETRRQIEIAEITEFHDGELQNTIFLHEFPVDSVFATVLEEDDVPIVAVDFNIAFDEGVLRLKDGAQFSEGESNVKVVYQGGFNVTGTAVPGQVLLPDELRFACKKIAGKIFNLREELGVTSKRFKDGTISFSHDLDEDVKAILKRHKRKIIA